MPATPVSQNLQPYFEKGIQAYAQGSYDYAVDLLSFVVRQSPDATEARRYLRLAIQKLYTQSPPSWLSQLASAIVGLPMRMGAGLCAMQGQYARAIRLYEQLLSLQPRSRGLLIRLASALERASLEDAAVSAYEELLGLDPNHASALRKVSGLSMKRGQDEQARRGFERILTVTPNDLEAQQGLRNLDALGTIKKGFTA